LKILLNHCTGPIVNLWLLQFLLETIRLQDWHNATWTQDHWMYKISQSGSLPGIMVDVIWCQLWTLADEVCCGNWHGGHGENGAHCSPSNRLWNISQCCSLTHSHRTLSCYKNTTQIDDDYYCHCHWTSGRLYYSVTPAEIVEGLRVCLCVHAICENGTREVYERTLIYRIILYDGRQRIVISQAYDTAVGFHYVCCFVIIHIHFAWSFPSYGMGSVAFFVILNESLVIYMVHVIAWHLSSSPCRTLRCI